ncbi:hypothetical protein EYF80_008633 [Liparis tanakae]|uniref:Uncharacterized protein n=1 Tax=Liparis tanakae TaxID=230148 RepID=A0A4Z2IT91_9TELE|nr:hypothetical protein EYF80_008633 [Liparis tanakae]
MIYSISSEKGFWKVKELVLIQIHSLDLERNRNITDRTWPFSFTTCGRELLSELFCIVRVELIIQGGAQPFRLCLVEDGCQGVRDVNDAASLTRHDKQEAIGCLQDELVESKDNQDTKISRCIQCTEQSQRLTSTGKPSHISFRSYSQGFWKEMRHQSPTGSVRVSVRVEAEEDGPAREPSERSRPREERKGSHITFSLLLLLGLLVLLGNQCWLLGERLADQSVGGRAGKLRVMGLKMPSWEATCCILLSPRSFSVSANFTTRLDDAPCEVRDED